MKIIKALTGPIAALSIAATALVPAPAFAKTTTTTFNVTASVAKNCTLGTVSALAFGAYNPGGGPVNNTTTVTVNCTKNTAFNIGLNQGSTTGGTVTTRLMTDGATPTPDTLQYTLWQDSAHSVNWGNTPGTDTVNGTGAGMGAPDALAYTVYGQIPDNATNQAAAPGTYSDTITVTVTY